MINKLIVAIYHTIESGLNDLLNLKPVLESLTKLQHIVWLWIFSITISIGFWISLEMTGFFFLLSQSITPLKAAILLLSAHFLVCVVFFLWLYKKLKPHEKTTTQIILLCKFIQNLKKQITSTR